MTQQEFTNRYQFSIKTDKIGGGSFGTVYKAYDNVLDREVAIKVSEVKYVGDKEFSLLEEFKAIENVPANKYIANYEEVYRYESFNGIYDYGLMQYYPLGNLSHYLKNNTVSQEKRESLVLGILEGIGYLHKHKVVHRDLKPSNILVVDRKGELIPKITDFGLSKQASADAKGSRFTNSFAGGTLQYSSPEQLKGLPLKLNTDLWSFGVIAYEILTGNALFETQSNSTISAEWQNEITQKILHQDITPALQTLPENWKNVVVYCLERDISNRAKSTEELHTLIGAKAQKPNIKDSPSLPDNKATLITGSTPREVTENKSSTNTKPIPKKLKPKWLVPVIGISSVLLIGSIFYITQHHTLETEEETLQLFEEDGLYGYKHGDSIIIPAQYTLARSFKNDKALVQTNDSSFYIGVDGNWYAQYIENKILLEGDNTEKLDLDKTISKKDKDKNKESKEVIKKPIKDTFIVDSKQIPKSELETWANTGNNLENIKHAANNGNAVAQRRLGRIYSFVYKDRKKANYWFKKAANQGDALAQFNYGASFYNGDGVEKDYTEAMKWYKKAAAQNYDIAQHNVGKMYYFGVGVEKDYTEAMKWYKKAAVQNYDIAQNNLGTMYDNGNGVTKDYTEAIKWYKKAANQGNAYAQKNLGLMYDHGKGVDYNWQEAVKWYKKAANQGNSRAKIEMAEFYLFGVGGVIQDIAKAKRLLTEASKSGFKKLAKRYLNVIREIENNEYFTINESRFGNRLFIEGSNLSNGPFLLSEDHDSTAKFKINYSLGYAEGVQIWPVPPSGKKYEDDEIFLPQYTSSEILTEKNGEHWSGKSISSWDKGFRAIGYYYYRADFYSDTYTREIQETLIIKVPVIVCWKPRNHY